jgi:hypothetical protein
MKVGTARKRPRLRWRGMLTLLLGVGFGAQGCGAAEQGATSGGAGGAHAGGATVSGGQAELGGSSAGGMAAGAKAGAAAGANTGTGGALARGGAGGQTQVGGGGAGGDVRVDPACHCVFYDFGADCVLSLQDFFARVRAPSSCENDLDFVIRSSCADGTTQRSWLEGSENDYLLVFDERGKPVYGSASGYVNALCGGNADDDGGWTLSAGTAPPASTCDTCTVCRAFSEGGAAGAGAICE